MDVGRRWVGVGVCGWGVWGGGGECVCVCVCVCVRVCVCVCVNAMASKSVQGARRGGEGVLANEDPPPQPVPASIRPGPQRGQLGDTIIFIASPSHFVLCHSWCLAQRGHDPYPHGSFHLVFRMPFRRSGIHGTKIFISFVVIITITSFIIFHHVKQPRVLH